MLKRARAAVVPISRCRHFCGFRYGSDSFNPYENYLVGLHRGVPRGELRAQLEDFVRHFRPRSFGEVFGIELSRHVPLWVYPWDPAGRDEAGRGWVAEPDDVPDILTHFCERGVLASRIDEECRWLERAYERMSAQGYRPREHSFAEAFELSDARDRVYVLTDGNHRVGALAALGHQDVMIKVVRSVRFGDDVVPRWPRVRDGTYGERDAMALCETYIAGTSGFQRSVRPAAILENGARRSAPALAAAGTGRSSGGPSRLLEKLRGAVRRARSAVARALGGGGR